MQCALLLLPLALAQPPYLPGFALSDPDLPGMPVAVREKGGDGQDCGFQCLGNSKCYGYNWADPQADCGLLKCPYDKGCCWLKASASGLTQRNISGTCQKKESYGSYVMRPNMQVVRKHEQRLSGRKPPRRRVVELENPKNVLYLLVDDMRPNLEPYNESFMHTPNLQALREGGLLFSRAYCNIAVCSPSRMSFLTGRYPATTKVWNFVNHFRQANCVEVVHRSFTTDVYKNITIINGGAGQCCSFCTADIGKCASWTFEQSPCEGEGGGIGICGLCELGSSSRPSRPRPNNKHRKGRRLRAERKRIRKRMLPPRAMATKITGVPGTLDMRKWISLPQHFLKAGYRVTSSGKIFHTEEGGMGPAPWDGPGTGMPPLQDPVSWSPGNFSMANVNAIAPMRPCGDTCSVNATLQGDVPPGTFRFCDRIIGDDGVSKLTAAMANFRKTGQPFFVAVGFRRPHLPFRHPAPYDNFYPDPSKIPLAEHQTMDKSVPTLAYHQGAAIADQNPYQPIPPLKAGTFRRDYYAAISWMDYNLGRVMQVLDSDPEISNQTLVVFHSDHGFSLGEHGAWEKFTNWEHGTRVPLIVRAPWLPKAKGQLSSSIVELVDVFPTIAELANNPVPPSYGLDGDSFADLVRDPNISLAKNNSLSVFPRCPSDTKDPSQWWAKNDCNMVERTNFFSMGVTLREDQWRYTEWLAWDPHNLVPLFDQTPLGIELYPHANDPNFSFDGPWEQVNYAGNPEYAQVQARLAGLLRERYHPKNQTTQNFSSHFAISAE